MNLAFCLPRPAKVSEGTSVKTICLVSKRYLVAAPLMLAGVVSTWYSAVANGRRGRTQSARIVRTLRCNFANSLMKTSTLVTELKRRKVYKVAVAYAVVSWLLIQAASIFLPTFDSPAWMMKAVVVFLALGFVPSAILSWIFDITAEGIKRTPDISSDDTVDIVRQLQAQARQEFVRGYLSALLYAGLGKTKAIDYLKREYLDLRQHQSCMHTSRCYACCAVQRSTVPCARGEAAVNRAPVAIKVTASAHVR